MAKKKSNPTVVNNIESVNMEIDYDKLAEAIVKAQEKANEKYSVSRELMKFVITPIFWILTVFSGVLSITFFAFLFASAKDLLSNENWVAGGLSLLFVFFVALFTLILTVFLGLTAKEIDEENDRNYIASIFSNIVAIVALIVALIALIKGVG